VTVRAPKALCLSATGTKFWGFHCIRRILG
jgi:hypothetical protein